MSKAIIQQPRSESKTRRTPASRTDQAGGTKKKRGRDQALPVYQRNGRDRLFKTQ